jgi:hypothetical protein
MEKELTSAMVQQGQIFELTRRAAGGSHLWAYRYRTGGRDSTRVQRGGFVSAEDAREALERASLSGCGGSGGSHAG